MDKIQKAKQSLKQKINTEDYHIALTLGSGLGSFEKKIKTKKKIPYEEIDGLHSSTVEGHKGELIFGEVKDTNIIAQNGRIHYYETGEMEPVIRPIRLLDEIGIQKLILTNAAGGVNPKYESGDLMIIKDHINNMGDNPLIGENYRDLPRFPDMTDTYDSGLISLINENAKNVEIDVHSGVYVANSGPSYETPAEVKMVKRIGGDAVGMSTVPEAIVANQHNIKVAGISTITNLAAGVSNEKLSHDEVKQTADQIQEPFNNLMMNIISSLD